MLLSCRLIVVLGCIEEKIQGINTGLCCLNVASVLMNSEMILVHVMIRVKMPLDVKVTDSDHKNPHMWSNHCHLIAWNSLFCSLIIVFYIYDLQELI